MRPEKPFQSTNNSNSIEKPFPSAMPTQQEIDLNILFPKEALDLNALFPDPEIKTLLKKVHKNRTDIEKMTERFQEELPGDLNSTQVPTEEKQT